MPSSSTLISREYVAKLLRCPEEPKLGAQTLSEFVAADIESGALIYIEAYERVHRNNVKVVLYQRQILLTDMCPIPHPN